MHEWTLIAKELNSKTIEDHGLVQRLWYSPKEKTLMICNAGVLMPLGLSHFTLISTVYEWLLLLLFTGVLNPARP